MKQTIKINLGGIIFHIDEDAFAKLKNYLDNVNRRFGNMEEGSEIVNDIESRIAELLQPKISEQKQSLTMEDIDGVIGIMGEPEEFEEYGEQGEGATKKTYTKITKKRLYRDPDNSVLGGVCGGFGVYTGMDPVLVRLIFFFLFFLMGPFNILLYIILWISVPKAITASQKLEMRGENITISNIEKSIKDEYQSVKGNFNKMKHSKNYERSKNVLNEIFLILGLVIKAVLKIVLVIIGIAFIIGGLAALTGLLGIITFHDMFPIGVINHHEMIFPFGFFLYTISSPIFVVCLLIVLIIPVLALIYGGIKLIFRFKAKDKLIGTAAFCIWFISALLLTYFITVEGKNYAKNGHSTKSSILTVPTSNTLYLEVNKKNSWYDEEDVYDYHPFGFFSNGSEKVYYGKPTLDIIKAKGDDIIINVDKKSKGKNKKSADINASSIDYTWTQDDSLLIIDPYFYINDKDCWKAPVVKITISLPVEKAVYINDDLDGIIYDIDNVSDTWDGDMLGKKWIMKENGLTCE